MTQPKPLPEIARCECGRRADVYLREYEVIKVKEHYVNCDCDWTGPTRKTKRGAILAWNRVMGQRHAVCDRITKLCHTPSGLLHDKYAPIVAELEKIRRGK